MIGMLQLLCMLILLRTSSHLTEAIQCNCPTTLAEGIDFSNAETGTGPIFLPPSPVPFIYRNMRKSEVEIMTHLAAVTWEDRNDIIWALKSVNKKCTESKATHVSINDPTQLANINNYIQCADDANFTGQFATLIQWTDFPADLEDCESKSTFEGLIITNGLKSYWILTFLQLDFAKTQMTGASDDRLTADEIMNGGCNGTYIVKLGSIDCVYPSSINETHLTVENKRNTYNRGDQVKLVCDEGYRIVTQDGGRPVYGPALKTVTCEAGNKWINAAPVDGYGMACQDPQCFIPDYVNITYMIIDNERIVGDIPIYVVGVSYKLRCNPGYVLVSGADNGTPIPGNNQLEITCLGQNRWDGLQEYDKIGVKCEEPQPNPKLSGCDIKDLNLNLALMTILGQSDNFTSGDTLDLLCNSGYELITLTCGEQNEWVGLIAGDSTGCEYTGICSGCNALVCEVCSGGTESMCEQTKQERCVKKGQMCVKIGDISADGDISVQLEVRDEDFCSKNVTLDMCSPTVVPRTCYKCSQPYCTSG